MTTNDKEVKKMFSIGDYVCFGIAGFMLICGILGLIMGSGIIAKVISSFVIVIPIVFVLILIFSFRIPAYNYNNSITQITTKHGINVRLSVGAINAGVTIQEIEKWTDEVVEHWKSNMGWATVATLLHGILVKTVDELFITIPETGRKVRGFYNGAIIGIVTIPKVDETITPFQLIKSLYRHELSHAIVFSNGGIQYSGTNAEEKHHILFLTTGLGA